MSNKERLDILLVEKNFFESRERAKRIIMSGKVLVDEKKIDKAGTLIDRVSVIRIIGEDIPFVSRGGLKLDKAIKTFAIDLNGKIAADIGASTGGFTDCMLQNHALKVYAIDVGYGQLAWKLRNDPRVINMERTNIRNVTSEMIDDKLNFASIDVAFISLEKVLPVVFDLLSADGEIIALIKPQFEAGRENVGKKGVVRDKKIHIAVIEKIFKIAEEIGFTINGLTFSPIKGPEGNIEYLIYLTKNKIALLNEIEIIKIVDEAHKVLND
ncbi:MAG: TlyA family RNA methyltransferase [Selenomonadaceae bacterium]|nr:TlyA family RNA methyltransferase [Selenomonadaceae bacterium]